MMSALITCISICLLQIEDIISLNARLMNKELINTKIKGK